MKSPLVALCLAILRNVCSLFLGPRCSTDFREGTVPKQP